MISLPSTILSCSGKCFNSTWHGLPNHSSCYSGCCCLDQLGAAHILPASLVCQQMLRPDSDPVYTDAEECFRLACPAPSPVHHPSPSLFAPSGSYGLVGEFPKFPNRPVLAPDLRHASGGSRPALHGLPSISVLVYVGGCCSLTLPGLLLASAPVSVSWIPVG